MRVVLFLAILLLQMNACTTILVGSKASSDGAFFVGRNIDSAADNAFLFKRYASKKHFKDAFYSTKEFDESGLDFTYKLKPFTMGYTSHPDYTNGHTYGEDGFNEAGVGISGTESIYANEKVLKLDPYTKDGITEMDIIDVVLPIAKSAKEGVEILGDIIQSKGAGEGMGVAFVDKNGIWYLETGSGHQFLARKIPDDKYFVSANQGRLKEYDQNSSDFIASKDLIGLAIKAGTYDPKKDKEFNFFKAYSKDDLNDTKYNYPRVWWLQKLYNPNLQQEISSNLPTFLTPFKKISLDDVKMGLRSHYDGTKFDFYNTGDFKNNIYRPISVFRTYQSHIFSVRPWLDKNIGLINYICIGMADIGVYLPYYYGADKFIDGYNVGTNEADDASIYWKYRKLQTLVMQNYKEFAPIVKSAYKEFESNLAIAQEQMEAKYLSTPDPKKAKEILNNFSLDMQNSALFLTKQLTNQIFTLLTRETDKKFKSLNNGKLD